MVAAAVPVEAEHDEILPNDLVHERMIDVVVVVEAPSVAAAAVVVVVWEEVVSNWLVAELRYHHYY